MNFIWTILFMALIGALIGGFTNHLAIKMLFRPHEAKYIGQWRLPFTPGLIPKRRDELAKQLGKTVTNYLLTPDTFRKKLLTPDMERKAEQFLQRKVEEHVLHSDRTIHNWLELAGAENLVGKTEQKLLAVVDEQLLAVRTKLTTGSLEDVMPSEWQKQVQQKIAPATTYILNRASRFIESPEGKLVFQQLIDDFLATKGTIGSMVNMFFGDSNKLVGKVQREALKFVEAQGTYDLLYNLIDTEWTRLQQRPVEELIGGFDWDGLFASIQAYVKKELDLEARLDKTIHDYWADGAAWTAEHVTPQLANFAFRQAEAQLEISLRKLKLDEIVKEQVDTFPVAVLEDLVLGISRREFKMITVLGALLGGVIGIVQGLIVFFTT
ncbi:membrane protein [Bacillus sp. OxB-1]|uniref:DUF445 domain-containing protein n=1 Tax=Bacillus sp. (strain OxB-1) TaxID=98228 RepID=UPI000581DD7F|nr:DUF445 family protein [Bacillus sp. OxB-1]BAQ08676.1 membrane protein [Bacillus sp. OxB-1]